jgi:predicted nuclease with TOPRIM domain
MRMAQGLLNSVQKERDALKEEISGLKAQLQSVKENADSRANDRLTEVSAAYHTGVCKRFRSDGAFQLEQQHADLEAKHRTLEAEHQELRSKQELGLPSAGSSHRNGSLEPTNGRQPRLSSGASDLEKQVIGFRQMIEDLQNENGELYQTIQDLHAQMKAADDDNKELASANKQTQEVWGMRRSVSSFPRFTNGIAFTLDRNLMHCTPRSRADLIRWKGQASRAVRQEMVVARMAKM